mgnify:CR=1 FL=1
MFGAGRIGSVSDEAARLGVSNMLVVCSAGRRRAANRAATALGDRCAGVCDAAVTIMSEEAFDTAMVEIKRTRADSILSLGGGSPLGLGKAVAHETGLTHISAPTTYSGSELRGDWRVVNFDALTYAGNLENLREVEGRAEYEFVRGDVSVTEDVERAAEEVNFPLFVKHYNSYASVDLSRKSRVLTPEGLRQQARKIMSRHGAALIEEYIAGTECAVLVAENPDDLTRPKTYTPVQYRFPKGESFKHAKLKWEDYDGLESFPVEDPGLDARLRQAAANFFVAIGGTSFGRRDIRHPL